MKKLAPHDSSVKPLDAVPAEEIDALDTRIALIQALPLGSGCRIGPTARGGDPVGGASLRA